MEQTNIDNSQNQTADASASLVITAAEGGVYLPDGNYKGQISKLEAREATMSDGEIVTYVDFHVTEAESGDTLKVGFPLRLTPKSDLGGLFTAFGLKIPAPGTPVDLNAVFGGQSVAFMVNQETNSNGTFSRIVKGSLRPVA